MKRALCLVALAACADAREYHQAYCVTVEGGESARVEAPARQWNAALGWEALHVTSCPPGASQVLVRLDSASIDAEALDGYSDWAQDGADATIDVRAGISVDHERAVLLHELGHVLTRSDAHSLDPRSARCETPGAHITAQDVDAVRSALFAEPATTR